MIQILLLSQSLLRLTHTSSRPHGRMGGTAVLVLVLLLLAVCGSGLLNSPPSGMVISFPPQLKRCAIAAGLGLGLLLPDGGLLAFAADPPFTQQQQQQQQPARGFQTKSGLKYFDLVEGTIGKTPRYGQLVSFYYTTYYKATPESPLDFVDSSFVSGKRPFLHKHGNGRIVRGIDEGLHTMKVGGKRRLVVPKSIGYNEFGLGPLPEDGGRRRKLGALLDLLDKDQGELIFDIELVLVAEDENDQGYYDDVAVSQEEVRKLVLKSLQNPGDVNFLEKLRETTPPNLLKK